MHFTTNVGVGAILLSAMAISAFPVTGVAPNSLATRGVNGDASIILPSSTTSTRPQNVRRDVGGAKNTKPAGPPPAAPVRKPTALSPGAPALPPQSPTVSKGKPSGPSTGGLNSPPLVPAQSAVKISKPPVLPAQATSKNNKPPVGITAVSPLPNTNCNPGKKRGKLGRRSNPWCDPWAANAAGGGFGGYNAGGSGANIWGGSSSANAWGSSGGAGGGGGGGGFNPWGSGGGAATVNDGGYSAVVGVEVPMSSMSGPSPGSAIKTRGLVNCFGVVVVTQAAAYGNAVAPALAHITGDAAGVAMLANFVQTVAQSGYAPVRIVVRQASLSQGMVPSWTPTNTNDLLAIRQQVQTRLLTLGVNPEFVSSSMGGANYRNRPLPEGTMWVTAQGSVFIDGTQR